MGIVLPQPNGHGHYLIFKSKMSLYRDDEVGVVGRYRGWCFTLNNFTEEEYETLLGTVCQYIVIGKETGESGTPHLQGFLYFENKKSLSQVKRLQPRAHWESAKGNSEQNFDYCSKDGDFQERGVRPMTPKRKGEVEIERFEQAWASAKAGDIDSIPADICIRFYRTLKEIGKDYMVRRDDGDSVTGVWICGLAGCGKSRRARAEYPLAYLKMCNKWWDGYQGEENVIIDDFGREHKVLGHHLKIWADRYAFLAETKGGAIQIRPKFIVVTSQYHIADIFEDAETCAAITRRMTLINMF